MSTFTAKNGQFLLDGKPQFVQAGEFHYYRTPADQWRHRLGLLQAAGFNALATYIPWIWHQLEEGVSDLDGHSHPMRNLAGFLDLAAEMGFLLIPRPGPYIMAETINEGIPPWVFTNYPQVAFVSQDRKIQNVVSYLHPDFLTCIRGWYKAVFAVLAPRQVTRGGKIIMLQLDNEMGMIQWVRNIIDTNPDTMARFAAYLEDAHGDQLHRRYPVNHLADFLREGILNPQQAYASRIVEDYRRFYRVYLGEYASFLWEEAKANGLEVPPVINIHGFGNGGKTFPIGISQLIDVMRIPGMLSATDVYPLHIDEGNFHQLLMVNEMTKALHNPEQPLFSIEFQSGGNQDFSGHQTSLYDLHSRLCFSSGMRAINHYLFTAGENDPILSPVKRHDWGPPIRNDGSLRRHYHRYPKLSRVLRAYGEALTLSQPETVTTIGFLLDYYMTEVNNEFTKEAARVITHQRDEVLFDMIARGLSLTHRSFDAVELSAGRLDAAEIPLLWVMMEQQCPAEVQHKLVDYVRQGGKLILAGRMCSADFEGKPCTTLKDAAGIGEIRSDPPFVESFINAFGYRDVPVSFLESYTGEFDEVFARRLDGGTVGFIQGIGNGQLMMLGAGFPANTLEDLDIVHQMGLKMGCPSLFTLSDWVDIRLSRGEKGSFLFINNYQDDPVETTIAYRGETMLGGNAVQLPARSGLILPINWQLNQDILVRYVTTEITDIVEDGARIVLKTAQAEFTAELTISGYSLDGAKTKEKSAGRERVLLHSKDGVMILRKRN